ncbi:hypothetical protein [Undibacterium baiyunense]|uniref:Uncharacterized protein n=1 Tax=Undibacterium baiyunense TaxID=2828731 RepID=A0A941DJ46_9BURK|nr:hypothetical protein [Undibacterium baiyunense]MBR7747842.1 hypothetical protein [Undibacterium baiyunense]
MTDVLARMSPIFQQAISTCGCYVFVVIGISVFAISAFSNTDNDAASNNRGL